MNARGYLMRVRRNQVWTLPTVVPYTQTVNVRMGPEFVVRRRLEIVWQSAKRSSPVYALCCRVCYPLCA